MEYDRPSGTIVSLQTYGDRDFEQSQNDRLDLELELNRRGVEHEVVLLDAPSKEALRITHRRYFETPRQLLELLRESVSKAG